MSRTVPLPSVAHMPRYLIERRFPKGHTFPVTLPVRLPQNRVVDGRNGVVAWVHSYVTPDKRASYCLWDGPSAEAVRAVVTEEDLPAGEIVEVRLLSPYFYL